MKFIDDQGQINIEDHDDNNIDTNSYRFFAERYVVFYKFLENEVVPYMREIYGDKLVNYSFDPFRTNIVISRTDIAFVSLVFTHSCCGDEYTMYIDIKIDDLDHKEWKEILKVNIEKGLI